jgi:hypothetical protein
MHPAPFPPPIQLYNDPRLRIDAVSETHVVVSLLDNPALPKMRVIGIDDSYAIPGPVSRVFFGLYRVDSIHYTCSPLTAYASHSPASGHEVTQTARPVPQCMHFSQYQPLSDPPFGIQQCRPAKQE